MRTRISIMMVVVLLAGFAGMALAQEATPSPSFGAVIGPITIAMATPLAMPTGAHEAAVIPTTAPQTDNVDDARLMACNAPILPSFVPYSLRAGDRLADLLVGVDNLTVTQLAAINCLDDVESLPVGAVIWLPAGSVAVMRGDATSAAHVARIAEVQLSHEAVLNHEGVTVSWEAEGTAAYFYPCPTDETLTCARPALAAGVPLTHEVRLRNFQYAEPKRYRLEVIGADGASVYEDVRVDVTCSQESLAPLSGRVRCAEQPALAVFAVWQAFQGGSMVYFSDTSEIWVLTNADQRVRVFEDTYNDTMILPTYDDVPDGLFAAQRGFGIVWEMMGGADGVLGWALAEETGFDALRQAAGRISYTTYIQAVDGQVFAVTFAPHDPTGYWVQVAG